jgi:drug/metabolite transporter (DMT)-like permease
LSLLVPILSLAAAVSWGVGDFSGGIATRLSNNFVAVFLAQFVGLLLATVLLLISAEAMPGREALLWGAAAGVSGAFGLGCFYLALSRGTMGLVAPLAALLAAAWPAAVALLRGDSVGQLALLGMIVALAAIVLISIPDRRLGTPVLPTYHGSRRGEWLLIIGAALGFGAFFLLIDASHDAGGAVWWPLFVVKLGGVMAVIAATLVLAPLGRFPGIKLGTAALLFGGVAGIGDLGGNLFFVLASDQGELAVAIVLTSLYPVVTAILARIFLHERLSPLRLAGVALAIVGVVLITIPS